MEWNKLAWARPLFQEHKGAKLLSLVLAAVTWYSIRGVIGVTRQVHGIPISVKVKGMAVLDQSDTAASVTFQGSQEDLAELMSAHERGQVKIMLSAKPDKADGSQVVTIPVRLEDIEGAKRVRPVKVNSPGSVTATLDEEAEEQFTVNVPRKGKPAVGQVASVTCIPATVRVRGPRTRLKRLGEENMLNVYTETIDLSGVVESFTRSLKVLSPGDQWGAVIEPSEVAASVTIERKPGNRTWKGVPVTALIRPGRSVKVELQPAAVDVTATGNNQLLDGLAADQVKVFVDCEKLDTGVTYDLPLTVYAGAGAEVTAAAAPAVVRVVLKEAR